MYCEDLAALLWWVVPAVLSQSAFALGRGSCRSAELRVFLLVSIQIQVQVERRPIHSNKPVWDPLFTHIQPARLLIYDQTSYDHLWLPSAGLCAS